MGAKFVQQGDVIDYTPAVAASAGDVVVQGNLLGVVQNDIAANRLGGLCVDGVFNLPKGGDAFAVGDTVYWDDTNNVATLTPAGNTRAGVCVKAAAAGDATVNVNLEPNALGLSGLLYAAVAASTAVTNTTVQTAFDKSVTIPAGSLKAGDVIRVLLQAIATATNSTDTLAVALQIAGADVVATPAVDVANNDIAVIMADIVVRTVGAGGTFVAAGFASLGTPGTATARAVNKASTAIDTTAALTIRGAATWSVANAGNSCRLDVLNAQLIRA